MKDTIPAWVWGPPVWTLSSQSDARFLPTASAARHPASQRRRCALSNQSSLEPGRKNRITIKNHQKKNKNRTHQASTGRKQPTHKPKGPACIVGEAAVELQLINTFIKDKTKKWEFKKIYQNNQKIHSRRLNSKVWHFCLESFKKNE